MTQMNGQYLLHKSGGIFKYEIHRVFNELLVWKTKPSG